MRLSLYRLTCRITLVLMFMTFLSPTFGWQLVADHEELAHSSPTSFFEQEHHHPEHADIIDVSSVHGHEHEDAHSMIGHMLSHMPISMVSPFEFAVVRSGMLTHTAPPLSVRLRLPEQPFRPPQHLFT